MKKWIAERKIVCRLKGGTIQEELLIQIGAPYTVESSSVNFSVSPETSACPIEISTPSVQISEIIYGADSIQALQLASNIDPYLRKLSKDYDLFFNDGEPYFEE